MQSGLHRKKIVDAVKKNMHKKLGLMRHRRSNSAPVSWEENIQLESEDFGGCNAS